jgi:hypothetical protein
MVDYDGMVNDSEPPSVFGLRGYHVMLATKVAEVFEVETRQIVQNIKKNNKKDPPLFPERYAFEITKQEQEHLRSLGVIPKPGRGGSRALPWVVTRKGAKGELLTPSSHTIRLRNDAMEGQDQDKLT